MNRMIIANLVHRPFRTMISVVAVAVEVTLILLIVGLSIGMLDDSRNRQAGIGADIMVQPPNSSLLMGVSGAPVSVKVADKIMKLPHVVAVAPVVTQLSTAGVVEVIDGIDMDSFNAVSGGFRYISGGPFEGPDDIIVDDLFAASKHLKVGDTVETLNHEFRISGIVEHGKGARKFLPLKTLQELIGAQGKATIFYVKLDNPNNADEVVSAIKNIPGMQQYGVHSLKEYLSLMTSSSIPMFSTFIDVVITIAMIIGFIVIFQAMYAAVMETDARDWHPEVAGCKQALHRECGAAGDGAHRHLRHHSRDCRQLRRQGRPADKIPDAANSDHEWMAGPGGGHRDRRLFAGRVLSRHQGRAEGSYRRPGVRIELLCRSILGSRGSVSISAKSLNSVQRFIKNVISDLASG